MIEIIVKGKMTIYEYVLIWYNDSKYIRVKYNDTDKYTHWEAFLGDKPKSSLELTHFKTPNSDILEDLYIKSLRKEKLERICNV